MTSKPTSLPSGWQPIASAPKQERVLVYVADPDDIGIVWGYQLEDGMWTEDETGREISMPTHWMPLPLPPVSDPPAYCDCADTGKSDCPRCGDGSKPAARTQLVGIDTAYMPDPPAAPRETERGNGVLVPSPELERMRQEIARLTYERNRDVEEYRLAFEGQKHLREQAEAEVTRLTSQLDEAVRRGIDFDRKQQHAEATIGALQRYVQHQPNCETVSALVSFVRPCSCGLSSLLKAEG